METKIEKLKQLQNQIETGTIQSNLFDELESRKMIEDEYSEEQVIAGDCRDESKAEQSLKKAFDYSLRLLTQRDYSIYKMKTKLKSRGFDKDQITATIVKLQSFNYLREDEYTRGRVKQLIVKGYANSYILQKLAQEEVFTEDSLVDEIRSTQDLGSQDQIVHLIEKKLRGKEIPDDYNLKMKLRDKVARFLLSKGHQFSEIGNHLNEKFR